MLLRYLLLSLLFAGISWGEDAFPKWASTKNSLIDINWTNKDGVRMFFLIHTEGYITVRTGDVEKRGQFTDKKDKAISSFVKYIYDLKQGEKKDGAITLVIQRRLDGKIERVRPVFKSHDELKDFDAYIEYFSKFVK
jgi:hypothetical protein